MRKWKAFIQGEGLHDQVTVDQSTEFVPTNLVSQPTDPSGTTVQEFYEQIISEPSTASGTSTVEVRSSSFVTRDNEKSQPKTLTQLMRLCESNEVAQLQEYFASHLEETDLDACDQYGWTLLMTAAVGNSSQTVELLLRLGANWSLCDRSGLSALELAQKNRRTQITELIRNWILAQEEKEQDQEDDSDPEEGDDTEPEGFEHYCEACRVKYKNMDLHDRSIAHLVCTHLPGNETTHYGIPESNKGFQLMLKSGWKRGGLGQSGDGRKFPVKTILKRDRKGLGIDKVKKVARVTHFDPFDPAAVESELRALRKEAPRTLQKNESEKQRHKDRSKEINFRRDFYTTE